MEHGRSDDVVDVRVLGVPRDLISPQLVGRDKPSDLI
jgi:hypothetical protein